MAITTTFVGVARFTATLLLLSSTASVASCSCSNIKAPDEIAICADRELSEKNVKMATTYAMLRNVRETPVRVLLLSGKGK